MTDTTHIETPTEGILTGRVKWFNSKSGYGFLTVVKGGDEEDVFVHHSAIEVKDEQYKYLVQGEYVDFRVSTTEDSEHKIQASNVTGVAGGPTMCETRMESRKERTEDSDTINSTTGRGNNWRPRGGRGDVKGIVRQELLNILQDENRRTRPARRRINEGVRDE